MTDRDFRGVALIAHGDEKIRRTLGGYASHSGFLVIEASDRSSALRLLSSDCCDFLVCGVEFVTFTSPSMLRQLRDRGLILPTACSETGLEERFQRAVDRATA